MQYKDVTPIISELVRLKNSIPLEIDVGRYLPEVRKNTHGEAVRSGLKKALRVIEQAPAVAAMPRWISVEDEYPDSKLKVLAIVYEDMYDMGEIKPCPAVHTAYTRGEDEGWFDWYTGDWLHVTHWMHLPEPPKED